MENSASYIPLVRPAVKILPQPNGRGQNVTIDTVAKIGKCFQHSEELIEDLKARAEFGKKKYGTYLKTHDDRNSILDGYQELLDAIVYFHKAIMEGHGELSGYWALLVRMAIDVNTWVAHDEGHKDG